MVEDFRVKGLSDDEIERIALNWRKALTDPDDPAPDVLVLLRKAGAEYKDTAGLEVVWKPDAEMGTAEAYAIRNRIFARETVRDLLGQGHGRARMTLIHEFGHHVLHPRDIEKPRLVAGNKTPKYIPTYASAEHQAKFFAACFLMPRDVVRRCTSAEELARICKVTIDAAKVRFEQVVGSRRPREIPPIYYEVRSELQRAGRRTGNSAGYSPNRSRWRPRSGVE